MKGPYLLTTQDLSTPILVKTSTINIPTAGFGLFAGTQFRKGEFVTEFDGELIDRKTAVFRRQCGVDTHIVSASHTELIDGIKITEKNFHGRGGGSFANADKKEKNCKIVKIAVVARGGNVEPRAPVECPEGWTPSHRVFLVALKEIARGSEILTDYGQNYWKFRKSDGSRAESEG